MESINKVVTNRATSQMMQGRNGISKYLTEKSGGDVLKVDVQSLLKSANKEMKTIMFSLNKVIKSNEETHK